MCACEYAVRLASSRKWFGVFRCLFGVRTVCVRGCAAGPGSFFSGLLLLVSKRQSPAERVLRLDPCRTKPPRAGKVDPDPG